MEEYIYEVAEEISRMRDSGPFTTNTTKHFNSNSGVTWTRDPN
jgi:hypothetical protein